MKTQSQIQKEEKNRYLEYIKGDCVFVMRVGFCKQPPPRIKVKAWVEGEEKCFWNGYEYYWDYVIGFKRINSIDNKETYYNNLSGFIELFEVEEYTILNYEYAKRFG